MGGYLYSVSKEKLVCFSLFTFRLSKVSLLFAFRLSEVSLLFAFRLSEVSLLSAFHFLLFVFQKLACFSLFAFRFSLFVFRFSVIGLCHVVTVICVHE